MTETTKRLEELLKTGLAYLVNASEAELKYQRAPGKWSKQELLGHLIDSGMNNLQRFTEIQFAEKPYKIRKYNQDELVLANDYQHADISELAEFWLALNRRIAIIMQQQTEETLSFAIGLPDGQLSDLRFLMVDYVDHLEYHVKQILTELPQS
ncbi:DinB family protein [Fluviicola sp.]|uniref:DinB family protein n=1 Tax=Fluviicola sp. TaxID=1917219 RepID=UPI0031D63932